MYRFNRKIQTYATERVKLTYLLLKYLAIFLAMGTLLVIITALTYSKSLMIWLLNLPCSEWVLLTGFMVYTFMFSVAIWVTVKAFCIGLDYLVLWLEVYFKLPYWVKDMSTKMRTLYRLFIRDVCYGSYDASWYVDTTDLDNDENRQRLLEFKRDNTSYLSLSALISILWVLLLKVVLPTMQEWLWGLITHF